MAAERSVIRNEVARIMARSLLKARKVNFEGLLYVANPHNSLQWYVLVTDLPRGGECLFTVTAAALPDRRFPANAPRIISHTPNTTFSTNENICVSTGEFHDEQLPNKSSRSKKSGYAVGWRAANGIHGFMRDVRNVMLQDHWDSGGGIGIKGLAHSEEQRRELARRSMQHNRREHAEVMRLFCQYSVEFPSDPVVRRWNEIQMQQQAAQMPPAERTTAPQSIATVMLGPVLWAAMVEDAGGEAAALEVVRKCDWLWNELDTKSAFARVMIAAAALHITGRSEAAASIIAGMEILAPLKERIAALGHGNAARSLVPLVRAAEKCDFPARDKHLADLRG